MDEDSRPLRPIRLSAALDGGDAVEYIMRETESGRWGFYVRMPQGFRCNFRQPYFLARIRAMQENEEMSSRIRHQPEPLYLQLSKAQIRELVNVQPISLHSFDAGALYVRIREGGLPSIDCDFGHFGRGALEPINSSIADATPLKVDAPADRCVVVKSSSSSRQPSFSLQGVGFEDIFVVANEESSTDQSSNVANDCVDDGSELPEDPLELSRLSPLLYEILVQAYKNREKTKQQILPQALALYFKELGSANYTTNPKPFNTGRDKEAAKLANRFYAYTMENTRAEPQPPVTVELPEDAFFPEYIHEYFARVIYSACCWHGLKDSDVRDNLQKLVAQLVGHGYWDADRNDQVQALVFFITGKNYKRRWRDGKWFHHQRAERTSKIPQTQKKSRVTGSSSTQG
jgi:hypothetical protein